MVNLTEKLENIRRKPEHIRLRYVWAMVAISMIFVIIIWFFSLKSSRTETAPAINSFDTSKITDQLNQGKESLQNASEGFQQALDNSSSQK